MMGSIKTAHGASVLALFTLILILQMVLTATWKLLSMKVCIFVERCKPFFRFQLSLKELCVLNVFVLLDGTEKKLLKKLQRT